MAVADVAVRPAETVSEESTGIDSSRAPIVALVGVLVVFVALASVVAVKTPAWESADEPSHVQNIETLVSGHWYGMNSKCGLGAAMKYCTGDEPQQAPLYYLLLAGWQKAAGVSVEPPFHSKVNDAFFHGEPGLFLNATSTEHRFLLWLRFPNVIIGAGTVLVAYFVVRRLTTDQWTPVVGSALVAFMPHFLFLSSFVTNDNLVDFLGALVTLAAVAYAQKPNPWRMTWIGGTLGLIAITKLSALPLYLVLLVALVVGGRWAKRIGHLALGFGVALVVSGWYFIQNSVRYGSPLAAGFTAKYLAPIGGLGTFDDQLYHVSDPLRLVLVDVPTNLASTFWYQSDWNLLKWPLWVGVVIILAVAAGLLGLIGRGTDGRVLFALWAIVVAGFASVWGVAFQTATYQARYAMVGLVALAALVALGTERWGRLVRWALPAAGFVGVLVAIQQTVLAIHWP